MPADSARPRLRPVRLRPGTDLRACVAALADTLPGRSGFVVAGIGSLVTARLRMAGEPGAREIAGPLEIVSLAGSISRDGVHLHAAVSDAAGAVLGGHVCEGCEIRTTAELLVAALPDFELAREFDPDSGFAELVVRPATPAPDDE